MDSYHDRIRTRRAGEASLLWNTMSAAGVTADTVLALDFTYFTSSANGAERLATALAENYTISREQRPEPGYWQVIGTTRPYGNQIDAQQWLEWVEYMVEIGLDHDCILSVWSAYDPQTHQTWSSRAFEVE